MSVFFGRKKHENTYPHDKKKPPSSPSASKGVFHIFHNVILGKTIFETKPNAYLLSASRTSPTV
ncbi:MAG: hypothetical protein RR666_03735, partial [Raoultibacter sp.]